MEFHNLVEVTELSWAAAAKEKERRKQLRSLLPRSKGLSSRAISAGFSPHRVSPMIYDVNLTKKGKIYMIFLAISFFLFATTASLIRFTSFFYLWLFDLWYIIERLSWRINQLYKSFKRLAFQQCLFFPTFWIDSLSTL